MAEKVILPNFLIVGAPKSGTTSLYYYLKQHPEIYMSPVKESQFLAYYGLSDEEFRKENYPYPSTIVGRHFDGYRRLFTNAEGKKAIGEASTNYLFYHDRVISTMDRFFANRRAVKIVMILRNPIEACHSFYIMQVMKGLESLTFEEALKDEKNRILKKHFIFCYKIRFFYYKQVKAYLDNFENVKIYIYEDLEKKPYWLFKDILHFLNVDNSVKSKIITKFNISGIPKNMIIHNVLTRANILKHIGKAMTTFFLGDTKRKELLNWMIKKNLNKKPELKPGTREKLKMLFNDDILKLQELIKGDLSNWLK